MTKRYSTKKIALLLGGCGVLMFGLGFAMVPFYQLICSLTGVNSVGATGGRVTAEEVTSLVVEKERAVTVQFDATLNGAFPGEFRPIQKQIVVHPGQTTEVAFYIKNSSDQDLITQAVPGVTPWQANPHLKKIECFCFNQQTLAAGEEKEMGLTFVIDNDLPTDINTVTLSYTLMDTNREKALSVKKVIGADDRNEEPSHEHDHHDHQHDHKLAEVAQ